MQPTQKAKDRSDFEVIDVEIVDFYPAQRAKKTRSGLMVGHIHVYIPHCDLDVRGISVFLVKNGLPKIRLPYMKGFCHKTKKPIFFPLIGWIKPDTKTKVVDSIRNGLKTFLADWEREHPEYKKPQV